MIVRHWIPAYNSQVHIGVVQQSVLDAVHCFDARVDYSFVSTHGCDLQQLRNEAVEKAIADGCDWLLMQDADNFSRHDHGAIVPMLETAKATGAAAVFAIVTIRNAGRANVWPVKPGEVYEVEKAGTGLVLIDLAQIRPWFDAYSGPLFFNLYSSKRASKREMGMDVFFSRLMRSEIPDIKPALKIVCDGRIPTRHINAIHALDYDGQRSPDAVSDGATAEAGNK